MKKKIILVLLLAAAVSGLWFSGLREAVSFDRIREQREVLRAMVEQRYLLSVLFFLLLTVSTAFFVPGAIVFIMAAGFFFGVIPGALFSAAGLTLGASAAFLVSRYLIGGWVQERYRIHLGAFNEEMRRHGHYYLLSLRVVPVIPFFLVNILAGLTGISFKRFVAVTALGMLPVVFLYSFAGRRLAGINSPREILSPGMIAALLLLALLILLPVILKTIVRARKKDK